MGIVIYVIKCPFTGMVKYVGKTKDTKERFRKHLSENNDTRKSKWVRGIKAKGSVPLFEIIDEVDEANWEEAERSYIRLFKSLGADLLNHLPGGEGGPTMLGRKLTDEQRAKISASKTGKKRPWLIQVNKERLSTRVRQYDLDGNFIKEHGSITDAARFINRDQRRIWMMVTGKGKKVNQVGGYRFSAA